MPKVISTLTDSVDYTKFHQPEGGGTPEAINTVTIKGGANLAQKRLVLLGEGSTKAGIETEVTEEQLAFLKEHPLFQTHVKNGFIEVVQSGKAKADTVAKDMAVDKASAQLTDADIDPKNPDARLKGHKLKSTKE